MYELHGYTFYADLLFMKQSIRILAACILAASMLPACRTKPPGVSPWPVEQPSFINVPVSIYAVPFLQKAASLSPPEITSPGWPALLQEGCGFRYKYRFVRSGLRITCVNNDAAIVLSGNYQVAGSKSICAFGKQVSPWISGSCGFNPEPMRRIEISVRSQLRFLPGYTIQSTSAVDKINATDKCTVTLLNTDITKYITETIRLSALSFSATLDREINALTFPDLIRMSAAQLGGGIALNDYGFIRMNPAAVAISALNYKKDTLHITVGLTCFPLITSETNIRRPVKPLPPLDTGALTNGFAVNLHAAYDYSFITSHLNSMVKGKTLYAGGNKIMVNGISARGLDKHRVELKVIFSGRKSGVILLTGTPVLDVQRQVISIPDLNYNLSSSNLLLTLGKTFLNKRVVRTIRRKAILKIGTVVGENRLRLDSLLHRSISPNAYTTGSISGLKVTGLKITEDSLHLQIRTAGNLSVIVTGF